MEIVLIRHGESEGNVEGRMQGRQDSPLSPRGRQQAERLGRWLAQRSMRWDAAYVSPLTRALETARIVADGVGGLAATVDPDLAEIDAGALEGMNRDDMLASHPGFFERAITDLGDFGPYGGESYDAVQERVARVRARLEALHRDKGQRALVVAHGGINFQLVKSLVCLPVPRVCIVRWGNCTATMIRMRERRGVYMGEVAWHVPLELMGAPEGEGSSGLFR